MVWTLQVVWTKQWLCKVASHWSLESDLKFVRTTWGWTRLLANTDIDTLTDVWTVTGTKDFYIKTPLIFDELPCDKLWRKTQISYLRKRKYCPAFLFYVQLLKNKCKVTGCQSKGVLMDYGKQGRALSWRENKHLFKARGGKKTSESSCLHLGHRKHCLFSYESQKAGIYVHYENQLSKATGPWQLRSAHF